MVLAMHGEAAAGIIPARATTLSPVAGSVITTTALRVITGMTAAVTTTGTVSGITVTSTTDTV